MKQDAIIAWYYQCDKSGRGSHEKKLLFLSNSNSKSLLRNPIKLYTTRKLMIHFEEDFNLK